MTEEEAGAAGVAVGGQGEVEVEGKEEAQLQLVELAQLDTPDLRPASEPVSIFTITYASCSG